MNREHKYRAWDKGKNRYLPDEFIEQLFLRQDGRVMWSHATGLEDVTEHFDIEEYTGRGDKNGKEIYEEDIFGSMKQMRCIVKRQDNGAYELVFLDKRIKPWSITDPRVSNSEAIGNVHDKPELKEINEQ